MLAVANLLGTGKHLLAMQGKGDDFAKQDDGKPDATAAMEPGFQAAWRHFWPVALHSPLVATVGSTRPLGSPLGVVGHWGGNWGAFQAACGLFLHMQLIWPG